MSPAMIDLPTAAKLSPNEAGQLTHQLSALKQAGMNIPRVAVIPRQTLEQIALITNLVKELKKTLRGIEIKNQQLETAIAQIKTTLRRTRLPDKITRPILNWYHQQPGFIRVTSAGTNQIITGESTPQHQNVKGDANLIDSILAVWAEHISLDLEHNQLQVFAEPILLIQQEQPMVSGVALTKSPTHKSQFQIFSTWGVYPQHHPEIKADMFLADIRTQQVVQRQLNPQYLQLVRAPDRLVEKAVMYYKQDQFSLDNQQVQWLIELVIKAKKKLTADCQLSWYFYQDQLWITDIQPLNEKLVAQTQQYQDQILVQGDSLQPGIIAGSVQHLTARTYARQLKSGQVLVASKITAKHLKSVTKAAALVCETGVSNPAIFQQLKSHAVPTIINARHATRYLKTGQKVIVDANSGRVLAFQDPNQPTSSIKPQLTATKVYISAGNPHKANQYLSRSVDGIGVLRSEYTLASLGEHPLHLARSKQRVRLKSALLNTIQTYQQSAVKFPVIYRAQNFTSQELSAFSHAASFEPTETNPYLGFRGGLRILSNFEFFNLELEVIKAALQQHNGHLGLMLPFIRTPGELGLIRQYIRDHHGLDHQPNFGLYLQLNTPENILQLERYLPLPLAGVSINARSLHALLHGIDPDNPDIYSLYSYNLELMKQLMERVLHHVRQNRFKNPATHQPPLAILHLEDYNLELVEIAAELGFEAVTVKPSLASRVKQRIQEIEAQNFHV